MATATAEHRTPTCAPGDPLAHLDREAAERVACLGKALADPVRVQILDLLGRSGGQVCQCDLQPSLGIAQPTLSHHLGKLVAAGLVDAERRGRWTHYTLRPDGARELVAWLS